MFVHLDRIHERDGRTDRRTPHDGIGRACIALLDKNAEVVQCRLLSGLFVNCLLTGLFDSVFSEAAKTRATSTVYSPEKP